MRMKRFVIGNEDRTEFSVSEPRRYNFGGLTTISPLEAETFNTREYAEEQINREDYYYKCYGLIYIYEIELTLEFV